LFFNPHQEIIFFSSIWFLDQVHAQDPVLGFAHFPRRQDLGPDLALLFVDSPAALGSVREYSLISFSSVSFFSARSQQYRSIRSLAQFCLSRHQVFVPMDFPLKLGPVLRCWFALVTAAIFRSVVRTEGCTIFLLGLVARDFRSSPMPALLLCSSRLVGLQFPRGSLGLCHRRALPESFLAARSGLCAKKLSASAWPALTVHLIPRKPKYAYCALVSFQKPARAQLSRLVFPALSFLPHEPSQ
jgi:hypothetical protein